QGSRHQVPPVGVEHVVVGDAHAALTKLRSARGPTSITRSARCTVSGTTPCGVHSTVTVTGAPSDAASTTPTATVPARIGNDPVSSVNSHLRPSVVGAAVIVTGTCSSHGSVATVAPISSQAPAIDTAGTRTGAETGSSRRLTRQRSEPPG